MRTAIMSLLFHLIHPIKVRHYISQVSLSPLPAPPRYLPLYIYVYMVCVIFVELTHLKMEAKFCDLLFANWGPRKDSGLSFSPRQED